MQQPELNSDLILKCIGLICNMDKDVKAHPMIIQTHLNLNYINAAKLLAATEDFLGQLSQTGITRLYHYANKDSNPSPKIITVPKI